MDPINPSVVLLRSCSSSIIAGACVSLRLCHHSSSPEGLPLCLNQTSVCVTPPLSFADVASWRGTLLVQDHFTALRGKGDARCTSCRMATHPQEGLGEVHRIKTPDPTWAGPCFERGDSCVLRRIADATADILPHCLTYVGKQRLGT